MPTGRRMRVPFRRLQSEFLRAGQKGTPQDWKRIGGLIDRNFDELRDADADQFIVFDRDAGFTGSESKPWTARHRLFIVAITADIPGGEAFEADLNVDGVVSATLSSASGTQAETDPGLLVEVPEDGVLTFTYAETGFDLVLTVWFTYR